MAENEQGDENLGFRTPDFGALFDWIGKHPILLALLVLLGLAWADGAFKDKPPAPVITNQINDISRYFTKGKGANYCLNKYDTYPEMINTCTEQQWRGYTFFRKSWAAHLSDQAAARKLALCFEQADSPNGRDWELAGGCAANLMLI